MTAAKAAEKPLVVEVTAPQGTFGRVVTDRMNDLGWDIRTTAANTSKKNPRHGLGYEFIRKIVRRIQVPSDNTLEVICNTLDLDFDDMKHMCDSERVQARFGNVVEDRKSVV